MASTGKRILALLLAALLLASTAVVALASQPQDAYVNDDEIYVRVGAGRNNANVTFKGSYIKLYRGQYVQIIGSGYDSGGALWYQIQFKYMGRDQIGYMHGDYVTKLERDDAFEAHMTEQGFPESYKPYLRALYTAFGKKWTFLADHTGLDWGTAVSKESILGVNLIQTSDDTLLSREAGAYDSATGTWKQYETGWYAPSRETVAFYLDPRSYLVDGTCVAFELMSGSSLITREQVAYTLRDCRWATDQIIDEFLQAGQEADVSAIYLATKARNELGTGNTTNASGYDINGTKVYNFFNVGAYGSASDPNYEGMVYAYNHGWTTSYKAILGGAQFIAGDYINDGQNTPYLQKFNLSKNSTYVHQYAANVRYAYDNSFDTYTTYAKPGFNMVDMGLILSIPILENMPEEPTAIPITAESPENPVYNYAESLGLQVSDSYISGFSVGISAQTVADRIHSINRNAEVTIRNMSGAEISSAAIGTGATITISDSAGTVNYTVVIYGDATGDGQINAGDMLAIKRHILGRETLSGARLRAAAGLSGGQVNAAGLLAIKRHILGKTYISQN